MKINCLWLVGMLLFLACGKKQSPTPEEILVPPLAPSNKTPSTSNGYDFEKNGVPKLVTAHYIELSKISRISKFRSGEGHDYSDNFEKCRSMKHYFQPFGNVNWADVKIYAPVSGTIEKIDQEWTGEQVHIIPDNYPDFKIILFHVHLNPSFDVGSRVATGQQLGLHVGLQTTSDVAISVNTTKGFKLVSWFDAISDALLNDYKLRGVASRSTVVITKDERDASKLSCSGETFASKGTLENWVVLK